MEPVAPMAAAVLMLFLLQAGLLLGLAWILGRAAVRFGMPAVVGELCAGVLLGPSVLAAVAPDAGAWLFPRDPGQFHLLDAAGQIGVLLLVGLTGMHLDLRLVRRRGAGAAGISAAGMAVPLGLGVATGLLVPAALVPGTTDRTTFALFLGVAIAVSAVPVLAKTLIELRLIHRDIGQLILCAVLVDDVVGWVLLSVVSAMAAAGVHTGEVAVTLGGVAVVALAAVLARRPVGALLRNAGSPVAPVAVLVLLAAAATQALGLEAVLGAFVCGIVVNATGAVDLERLAPLHTVVMTVLAPLFFATAGLRMDLTSLADPAVLLTGLCVLAVAVAGKFGGTYAGARFARLGHWEALAVGAGMNARGVIEVIIAMVGLRLGVLGPETYTVIVLVAVATSLMAPPLLRMSMARVDHTEEERLREAAAGGVPAPVRRGGPERPPAP